MPQAAIERARRWAGNISCITLPYCMKPMPSMKVKTNTQVSERMMLSDIQMPKAQGIQTTNMVVRVSSLPPLKPLRVIQSAM